VENYLRAKQVAATIHQGVASLVGGYVTEYDDSFNPRAFGDNMQVWGTATVLIESGGWRMDPEKQYLRAVNFVALVTALDAIAEGSFASAPIALYDALPSNGRSVNDLLIRGGMIVLPGMPPIRADISADFEGGSGRPFRARIVEVGDLSAVEARDTLGVDGLYLHPLGADSTRIPRVLPGMDASFSVRTGSAANSEEVFCLERGVRRGSS
jgi:hypothetical protein